MNTRNARLKAASLIGLATLGGGMATMSTASASSTTPVVAGANLNKTDTSFVKSNIVQAPSKHARVTGTARPDSNTVEVFWNDPTTQVSYTQTYTLQTVGYMITSSSDLTATTATNTNVRTGPGVNYPVVTTLKANVTLNGETSSGQTLDLNNKVLSSSSTGHWMRITSGPYAGKYINTAVMKNLIPHGTQSAEGPRMDWKLTSVSAVA